MKHAIGLLLCIFIFSFTQAQTRSYKRGLCFNTLMEEDVEVLSQGVSWAYNWGHGGSGVDAAFESNDFEYVPMAWSGLNKSTIRNYLRAHPNVKYILGFNEPNFGDQANMGPAAAAARWGDIEEIADEFGLTIVGPAVNYAGANAVVENGIAYTDPVRYLEDFFKACPDCRVDHIAVHFYMGSAGAIMSSVNSFKKFKKPIWLTEFCANGTNQTERSQTKFMLETLDALETDSCVYRYAWFKERGNFATLPNMSVLDPRKEGTLKDLGKVFVHMSSYDDNFYFTLDQRIPTEHYIRMSRINMEATTDISDNINAYDMGTASWLDYNVDIPEAGEYNIFFRLAAEYDDVSIIRISVDGQELGSKTIEKKGVGVWDTQQFKANLSAGKQKIRVNFKQGGVKLNWWYISKSETPPSAGVENIAMDNDVSVYPNPVTDILHINIPNENTKVSLLDVSGKCVYSAANVTEIDMTPFAAGMYFLDIQGEKGKRKVEKILKNNL